MHPKRHHQQAVLCMAEAIKFRNARMESGRLIIEIPADQRGAVMNFIRCMKNAWYDLDIKLHKEKRSNDANKYFWLLAGKVAANRRISPVEVYREYIRDIGDNFTFSTVADTDAGRFTKAWERSGLGWIAEVMGPSIEQGKTDIICYYGSSYYDTAQMSRLIDLVVQDCKDLGIETLTPEKLSILKESWQ